MTLRQKLPKNRMLIMRSPGRCWCMRVASVNRLTRTSLLRGFQSIDHRGSSGTPVLVSVVESDVMKG